MTHPNPSLVPGPEPALPRRTELALEQHYSPAELAKLWGLHPQTVRGWFHGVPGVLPVKRERLCGKRSYVTLRIPESVAVRVHREKRNR